MREKIREHSEHVAEQHLGLVEGSQSQLTSRHVVGECIIYFPLRISPGGGGYMTCGWTGVCRPVFRKIPSSNYRSLLSYPPLWRILAENHPFLTIFRQFLENPPMFMENLPKKGPLSREFWAQKPTHMGGTYPYPQHVMYPPPPGRISHTETEQRELRKSAKVCSHPFQVM